MSTTLRPGTPPAPRVPNLVRAAIPTALVLGVALAAPAQEPAPARLARIAVINMNQVSSESLLGKSYAAKIEALDGEIQAEGTKKQADLQRRDAELKALREELQKQVGVLSPEAAEKKQQEIRKRERERQAFLEDGQAEIQRLQERARKEAQNLNGEFQLKIRPHIEAVAKDKGIDILLDSSVALAVTRDYDISRDVIVKADDAERAKAKAAAPEPTPTPGS